MYRIYTISHLDTNVNSKGRKNFLPLFLFCRFQHIFDEDAVALCRIIHQHMGYRADKFAVLYNGGTGH